MARENPQQEEKSIITKKVDFPKSVQQRNLALSPEEGQQLLEPKTIAGEPCQKTSAAAGRSSSAAKLLRFLVAALRLNSKEFGRSGAVHGSTIQIFLQGWEIVF